MVDLDVLFQEIDTIEKRGIDTSKLLVSANAHVIPSYNKNSGCCERKNSWVKDRLVQQVAEYNSTYADKMNRVGIRIQDIFDESILRQKLEGVLMRTNPMLTQVLARKKFYLKQYCKSC